VPIAEATASEPPHTITKKPARAVKIIDIVFLCLDKNINLETKREARSVQNALAEISAKDTHTLGRITPDISTSKPHLLLPFNTARIVDAVEVLSARY